MEVKRRVGIHIKITSVSGPSNNRAVRYVIRRMMRGGTEAPFFVVVVGDIDGVYDDGEDGIRELLADRKVWHKPASELYVRQRIGRRVERTNTRETRVNLEGV